MTSHKIVVATGQALSSIEKPIHIALYITPASPYAILPDRGPLVYRTLTFSGKPNEQQSISWPSSIYLAHYTLAASSGTPIVRADGAVKIDPDRRTRYLKLGPDLKWKSEKLAHNPNPGAPVPPVLLFNDSGTTQQFAFVHRHGEEIQPCVLLEPLDHREGMYTNFTLQACQVPEHLRDGEHLDVSLLKPMIKPTLDLSSLREDIQLQLHISNNVGQTCTLSYNARQGKNGGFDSKRRVSTEPSAPPRVVNGGDKVVSTHGDEGTFVQGVELCEQDISIEQVRKIVMRSLHQSGVKIS